MINIRTRILLTLMNSLENIRVLIKYAFFKIFSGIQTSVVFVLPSQSKWINKIESSKIKYNILDDI